MPRDHFSKENAMPKKDELDEKDRETDEQSTKENAMPKKAPEPSAAEGSTEEGLVKMQKDGAVLHVHPTAAKAHASAGWKHA
jgi:hypothetical protein